MQCIKTRIEWLTRIIAALTGTCIFGDAVTFINKDCRVLFWRYFHCAFLGFCLGIFDSNVQPGVGKFGCIWLEWFARGQGIWRQIFEKMSNPHPKLRPPDVTEGKCRNEFDMFRSSYFLSFFLFSFFGSSHFRPIRLCLSSLSSLS